VLDEPVTDYVMGQEVPWPAAAIDFGGKAFVSVDGRVVSISHLEANTSITTWIASRLQGLLKADGRLLRKPTGPTPTLASLEPTMEEIPIAMRFRGPRTVENSIRSVVSSGSGNFLAAHDRWVVDARMKPGSRSTHEHRLLAKVLQWGFEVDGMNIKNSVAMEYVNRRRVLLEDAHGADPDNPNWEGAHHWMGEDEKGGAAAGGTEALRAHVAQEFSKESAIAKGRRKAMEAKKAKGGGKDDKG
jgi:hypothetical protein